MDGESGLLVAMDDAAGLADALRRLAGDRRLREAFGTAAQAHVMARYDAARLLRDMDELYTSLLRRAGVSP
jgi:glycosyltransferase involved in cell wall biosynthesis